MINLTCWCVTLLVLNRCRFILFWLPASVSFFFFEKGRRQSRFRPNGHNPHRPAWPTPTPAANRLAATTPTPSSPPPIQSQPLATPTQQRHTATTAHPQPRPTPCTPCAPPVPPQPPSLLSLLPPSLPNRRLLQRPSTCRARNATPVPLYSAGRRS